MEKVTLESLAARVTELERKLAELPAEPKKDWRRVVGIIGDSELAEQAAAYGRVYRESQRLEADLAEFEMIVVDATSPPDPITVGPPE